ncbi:sigma factor-like helix-turn-helix DNA-binding protein [Phytohabitans rumicis]
MRTPVAAIVWHHSSQLGCRHRRRSSRRARLHQATAPPPSQPDAPHGRRRVAARRSTDAGSGCPLRSWPPSAEHLRIVLRRRRLGSRPTRVALIAALRRPTRDAVLHHLADLPVEEVAAVLGVPVGTVDAGLSRGRRWRCW